MEYRLSELPGGGVAATDATIREIARICQNDLRSGPAVRFHATRILQDARVAGKDQVREAKAIFEWVRSHVRYQKDPVGIETVQSPVVTLRLRAGDCDDHAALVAALASAVGIPSRFRVVGATVNNLMHIVPELFAGGRWWWADTTERFPFGVRPGRFPVERVYSLRGEVNMLGQSDTLPITGDQFKGLVREAVWKTLSNNWRNGVINLADLRGYLRVINEGNFFSKKPLLLEPTRDTIEAFIHWAPNNLGPARKMGGGISSASGLAGLDGFLSSIVKAVGSVVKGAVNLVTGGGQKPVVVNIPGTAQSATIAPTAPAVSPVYSQPPSEAGMPSYMWLVIGGIALVALIPLLTSRGRS
jgi:hypothetical protein